MTSRSKDQDTRTRKPNVRAHQPLGVFFPDKGAAKSKSLADRIQDIPVVQERDQLMRDSLDEPILCRIGCLLRLNKAEEQRCMMILTLHFIEFYNVKGRRCLEPIHLFDISSVRIEPISQKLKNQGVAYRILLYAKKRTRHSHSSQKEIINCQIISIDGLKFTQYLYRNYMLSTVVYDETKKWEFISSDLNHEFPQFTKQCLSPSQQYQLTYFCFCARIASDHAGDKNTYKYSHEIVRFYHEHLLFKNGIFDFAMLKHYKRDLEPAIQAMMFVPYVMAFLAYDLKVTNFSASIQQILENSQYLKVLHVPNCSINTKGMEKIGKGLSNHNKKTKSITKTNAIQYWNFSDNQIEYAENFFNALLSYQIDTKKKFPIFYLSFSNCNIQGMDSFFNALKKNRDLLSIKYLYFNGNNVSDNDLRAFQEYLENKKSEQCELVKLGIAGDGPELKKTFEKLLDPNFQIAELSLAGTRIVRDSQSYYQPSTGAKAIIDYISQTEILEILDLSNTNIEKEDLVLILEKYNQSKAKKCHVRLNNICPANKTNIVQEDDFEDDTSLQLKKSRMLIAAATAFNYTDMTKWSALEFADNDLSAFELDFLLSIFRNMPNLKSINLSYNFKSFEPDSETPDQAKMDSRSIKDVLPFIIKNPITKAPIYLQEIYLAGCHHHRLGDILIPFLDQLISIQQDLDSSTIETNGLRILDLSGQYIGDDGYHKFTQLVNICKNLSELIIDNNRPENLRVFYGLIRAVMKKKTMLYFPFPSFDMIKLIDDKNEYMEEYRGNLHTKDYEKKKNILSWHLFKLRNKCDETINNNRKLAGMYPQLPFKTVPELESMSGDIHKKMETLLEERSDLRPNLHGGVSFDIDVPLPQFPEIENYPPSSFKKFEKYVQHFTDTQPEPLNSVNKELKKKYHSPNICKCCIEEQVSQRGEFEEAHFRQFLDTENIFPEYQADDDGIPDPPNYKNANYGDNNSDQEEIERTDGDDGNNDDYSDNYDDSYEEDYDEDYESN